MFLEAYLNTAQHLIEQYDCQLPLHQYVKLYFNQNRQFGSRDRKIIKELLFGFYRLGQCQGLITSRAQMLAGAWLSDRLPVHFWHKADPILAQYLHLSTEDRLQWLITQRKAELISPVDEKEIGTDIHNWIVRLCIPSRVFIRIRHQADNIQANLKSAGIEYQMHGASCLSVTSAIDLEKLLPPSDYVVQDIASQQVINHSPVKPNQTWWDCCTASGGKAIQLLDKQASIRLFVSDIRSSILHNLEQRMKRYGHENRYESFIQDASIPLPKHLSWNADVVLCDAPCSGSGTWSACPEQFYFFSRQKLQGFVQTQQNILRQVMQKIKPGGKLIYCTCSIFKAENESHLSLFDHPWILLEQRYFDYRQQGGQCIYMAIWQNQGISN